MIRASILSSCGFSLFIALTLAPTFPALGQMPVILVANANTASLPKEAAAVRTAGMVIGAALAEAGYHVFGKISAASTGIKIGYAVFVDIRNEIILSRASLRIEATIKEHPSGRHLGRIENITKSPIRIPEKCTAACLDTRLGPPTVQIARRVARELDARLRTHSRLSRNTERPSRDW